MNALALASGGLDSTIMLYHYREQIKKVMFVNYGSKHNMTEASFLTKTCNKLKLPLIFLDVSSAFSELSKSSALMRGGKELPKNVLPSDEIQSQTVVPFRNGVLISLAVAHAWNDNISHILLAANKDDAVIYPDCRESFMVNMNNAIKYGTETRVTLFAPYIIYTKKEIVQRHFFTLLKNCDLSTESYSCYNGHAIHCGTCAACLARKEALGELDKTNYIE